MVTLNSILHTWTTVIGRLADVWDVVATNMLVEVMSVDV